MRRFFTLDKLSVYFKFLVTFVLYAVVQDLTAINSFSKLAIALLEFIIILELVRILLEFLFSSDNRIKLRLMIDSTIVFFIRDIMLIVNDNLDIYKVMSIMGIIAILFVFRVVAMKYSPSILEKQYRDNAQK